ncbi:MAG TPA: hypothetical protein V6C65_20415 [Allocoleopsis sp.]
MESASPLGFVSQSFVVFTSNQLQTFNDLRVADRFYPFGSTHTAK